MVTEGGAEAVQIRGGRVAEAHSERAQLHTTDRTDRMMVRTAQMEVAVRDEAEAAVALDEAIALAEHAEGYVASESPRSVQLRIPDRQLEATLDALGALGEVARRDVRAENVTMQYTDLEIRLANALALQARLRTLLDRATTVQEVLEVERELARVTTEVERLEGQIRFYANQIAYSTVLFSVREEVRPGPIGYVVVGTYEAIKWLFVRG